MTLILAVLKQMKILITGGTGFIGQQLVALLCTQHQITVLTRNTHNAKKILGDLPRYIENLNELDNLNQYDTVINLAGEPILNKRWSKQQKEELCQSRWQITAKLSELIAKSSNPPCCFISASAVGYYGDQGATFPVNESTLPHNEFTHQLCQEWERLALLAQSHLTRVCILRIGIVLGHNGGALSRMLPAFKLGLGGVIAKGNQAMSWIHIRDLLRMIQFLIAQNECQGVFNATSPNPISNRGFTKTLGKILRRPSFMAMPQFALNMIMGEMSCLLTKGQYALPKNIMTHGFVFNYPELESALKQIIGK